MTTVNDRSAKRTAVLELLERRGARSVLLTGTATLGWYLDGARVHIGLSAGPVLSVRVSADGDTVHTGSNEAARLLAEELPGDLRVNPRPWYAGLAAEADLTESDVETELRALRRSLTATEIERFRALGLDAASVLTDALLAANPATTGFELASAVAQGVTERGGDALVLLVGGESRSAVRHPLPTVDPLGRRAMLVVCARRHGLIANATRWVRFGEATADEADADRRILEVEADAFAATRPGATLGGVLDAITASYPAHGFAASRVARASPGRRGGLRHPRPARDAGRHGGGGAAPGLRVESRPGPVPRSKTRCSSPRAGVEVLTADPRWPVEQVRGVARPRVLEL